MAFSEDSWWVKLNRASKHLDEINRIDLAYAKVTPYEAIRAREPKRHRDITQYLLSMTQQPDGAVAVVVGDLIHNARSALDHLAVAMAPRTRQRSAGFPILDPHAPDFREKFGKLTCGMPDDAIKFLQWLQPGRNPNEVQRVLRALSGWDNADKHRSLLAIPGGVENGLCEITANGAIIARPYWYYREDGAVLAEVPVSLLKGEVKIEVRGTARIAVKYAHAGLTWTMQDIGVMLNVLSNQVVRPLEPYVRRP